MFINMKMCQTYDVCFLFNLGNKNLRIYHHFSLILCYFWRQNCLKTSILAFWATLVNTCWPYVCDMPKWSLGDCKYLKSFPPNITSRNPKLITGGRKDHFLPLQWVDGITTFNFNKHKYIMVKRALRNSYTVFRLKLRKKLRIMIFYSKILTIFYLQILTK